MKNAGIKFAGFVLVMAMMLAGSGRLWAQDDADADAMSVAQPDSGGTIQLTARTTTVINGIRAELRGDYRAAATPIRLNSQLENLNLPIGTPVAFCLLQGTVKHMVGVGKVAIIGGVRTAKVELATSDGEHVPVVRVGDRLQARQTKVAPFNRPPTCASPLLTSAAFQ
jgi:hypothetical protein